MTTRDHQAVPLAHRIGIGDAERQLVLQQHPAAALQRAEHTARFAVAVAGLQVAEAERLQVADGLRAALVLPLRGRLRLGDDGCHLQGPLVRGLLGNSLAPQHSQRPRALVSTRYFTEPLIGLRWRLR